MAIEIGLFPGVNKNADIVYSPRPLMNTSKNPAKTPGDITGKEILKKVFKLLAPRFFEASIYPSLS